MSKAFKIFLVLICFAIAIYGFMIKLPGRFRHIDKELHSVFYFVAAAFLTLIFANKKLVGHILICGGLYLFGMAIEYAQEYSNKISRSRIHGRYDPEDLQYNLYGLIGFSIVWVIYVACSFLYNKTQLKKTQ